MILNQDGKPYRADGWYNDQTGYGGVDDNIKNTRYLQDIQLSYYELQSLYAGNWIFNKGVTIPIEDRLDAGIEFVINDDASEGRRNRINELEIFLEDLDALELEKQATLWESVYGGALLYFEFGDDEPRYELRDSQRGKVSKIYAVDRWNVSSLSYYTEEVHGKGHPKIGLPEVYMITLQTTGWSKVAYAHSSRVIRFGGIPLPQRMRAEQHMWGGSVIQLVYDICRYFDIGLKAMADTLEDFNWKTLEIENLPDIIANNTEGDTKSVLMRIAAFAGKNYHNQNVGMHGPGTVLKKHSTPVTGLREMVDLFSNFVASAFPPGIPDSIFFAAKGGALAGTAAEADIRSYYKRLRRQQNRIDAPRIRQILWMLGYDPEEYPFKFPPLEEPTELEKLEADDKQADIDVKMINAQVITPEEVAVSRYAQPEPTRRQYIIDFEEREKMAADEENDFEEEKEDSEDDEEKNMVKNERESENDRADMSEDKLMEIRDFFELIVKEN